MSDRLPVLVADLIEESARDFLENVARENEETWVPLVAAPVDTSRHILEVYTPGCGAPLRLIAEPMGPPSEYGFPLRLSEPSPDDLGDESNPDLADVVREVQAPPHDEPFFATDDLPPPGPLPAPNAPPRSLRGDRQSSPPAADAGTTNRPPPPPPVEPTGAPAPRPSGGYSFQRADTPTQMKVGKSRKPSIRVSKEHADVLAGKVAATAAAPAASGPATDPHVGRSLAGGKLVIEGLLGMGMMGAVYRARHRELQLPVAVKVMHEVYQRDVDFCRRFYAEALAASRLDHPNLMRVIDFGQEADGLLYLAMEFLGGKNLRQIAYTDGPLPPKRIAEIMMQVCAGLGQAHARGIVHRDVKPDNFVLVEATNDDGDVIQQVKVCDFGLAIKNTEGKGERMAGTPVYMAPEQVRGEDVDARTDVYACGIIIFELASLKVPFLDDDPRKVMQMQVTAEAPLLRTAHPDADPRVERIVQKALRKAPAERYGSMRELRADLKKLLEADKVDKVFDLQAEVRRVSSAPPPPNHGLGPAPAVEPSPQPPPFDAPPMSARGSIPPAPAAAAQSMDAVVDSSRSPASRPKVASWFEDNQDSYAQFFTDMNVKKVEGSSLVREPKRWLAAFLAERDAKTFELMFDEMELAVPNLARAADARTLWAISSTVHGLATDETRPARIRTRAAAFQRVFADPNHLARIAERMELRNDEHREPARSMLVRAGVAGAYALYGARVKHAADPAVRRPFIDTMRMLGEAAWPVVRAALEKIPDTALTGEHPAAATLAEDLLLCVPRLRDESAGNVVAKFVRARDQRLCRAATQALGRLWAERAAPLFLGLLADPDDGIRTAALVGLRQISAVDEHVVRRLAPILEGKVPAGPQLYLAVVVAMEFVTPGARPVAVPLLVRLVRDQQNDALVLAASKSLLSIMGNEARAVVIDRSDRAAEPLKSHLLELLKDPDLPAAELEDLD